MSENYSKFQEKFRTEELVLFETEYWRWSLRPVQVTVGAGILSLKRPEERLSGITEDESKDFVNIVKVIENTLLGIFSYKRINYLMLMMIDFHVHYHVIPRYDKEITCVNEKWIDADYPKPPAIVGSPTDGNILKELLDCIKDKVASL